MRNFCLLILLLICIPAIYFSSCAKVENDEKDLPVMSEISINLNDTIMYLDPLTNKRRALKFNDSISRSKIDPKDRVDTVIIGKWMYISARFKDEGGLSTFKAGDTLVYKDINDNKNNKLDSALKIVKLGQSIFGQTDIYVSRSRLIQLPDTIRRTGIAYGNQRNDTLIRRTENHKLLVACMDKSGNKDSTYVPIRIITRKEFIESRTR
ncbi:hypothetical protein JGH11_06775 [Dysgonomonas sp. Marseille-P4677]|uniref:hypothetical protein n=1 Tax=Dysgonomonas sp. Marseille-P4677 TaxID=2364790 RepID=UPI0019129052|nr:hypothetical protein [Dysgonomonas sp. Marseille-P4677]MBK5720571.1 hypothetical protein [Dysgonomonas sp. Marseille-P4677]